MVQCGVVLSSAGVLVKQDSPMLHDSTWADVIL
jgi:hypothetical protein